MSKYTKSARGKECQVRIPGVCNSNPETVVFAHLNGGGMGMKHSDIHGSYTCSACHEWLDGGYVKEDIPRHVRDAMHWGGMLRTQIIMIGNGVLKL